ncbi:hypothetical protein ABFS82_08G078300 [Erythranthe guttata]
MEYSYVSSSVLKLVFVLSLLSITTNAQNNKLFSYICPRTKNPSACLSLLQNDQRTKGATSLQDLGLGSLTISLDQVKIATDLLNDSIKTKSLPDKEKSLYVSCLNYYNLTNVLLSDAKTAFGTHKIMSARRKIAEIVSVSISCRTLGSPVPELKKAIDLSGVIFDVTYVIVKEDQRPPVDLN